MGGLGRRAFIQSAVAVMVASISGTAEGQRQAASRLALAAQHAGRFFGSAARIDHIARYPALRALVTGDCQSITPEFHMNWNCLEPSEGKTFYGPADGLCDFARDNGMEVRGHSLLWDPSAPPWAKKMLRDRRDWQDVAAYFARVMPHFGDRVQAWDVVNEAVDVNDRADGLRENIFLEAFGPDYVARAFDTAKLLAPTARLTINDYGFEYGNDTEERRRIGFLKLLEKLKNRAVPVDDVGLQAHLDLSKGPLQQRKISDFVNAIANMGYGIVVTELDVMEDGTAGEIAARDARVAREVTDYLDVVLAEPAVKGIVTWGTTDRFSWLQREDQLAGMIQRPERLNRGLPYDLRLDRKPFYDAMVQSFNRFHPSAA